MTKRDGSRVSIPCSGNYISIGSNWDCEIVFSKMNLNTHILLLDKDCAILKTETGKDKIVKEKECFQLGRRSFFYEMIRNMVSVHFPIFLNVC